MEALIGGDGDGRGGGEGHRTTKKRIGGGRVGGFHLADVSGGGISRRTARRLRKATSRVAVVDVEMLGIRLESMMEVSVCTMLDDTEAGPMEVVSHTIDFNVWRLLVTGMRNCTWMTSSLVLYGVEVSAKLLRPVADSAAAAANAAAANLNALMAQQQREQQQYQQQQELVQRRAAAVMASNRQNNYAAGHFQQRNQGLARRISLGGAGGPEEYSQFTHPNDFSRYREALPGGFPQGDYGGAGVPMSYNQGAGDPRGVGHGFAATAGGGNSLQRNANSSATSGGGMEKKTVGSRGSLNRLSRRFTRRERPLSDGQVQAAGGWPWGRRRRQSSSLKFHGGGAGGALSQKHSGETEVAQLQSRGSLRSWMQKRQTFGGFGRSMTRSGPFRKKVSSGSEAVRGGSMANSVTSVDGGRLIRAINSDCEDYEMTALQQRRHPGPAHATSAPLRMSRSRSVLSGMLGSTRLSRFLSRTDGGGSNSQGIVGPFDATDRRLGGGTPGAATTAGLKAEHDSFREGGGPQVVSAKGSLGSVSSRLGFRFAQQSPKSSLSSDRGRRLKRAKDLRSRCEQLEMELKKLRAF